MEIFMISRVDVVTVKSHPPIDNAREIHLEHKKNTLGTQEKYTWNTREIHWAHQRNTVAQM